MQSAFFLRGMVLLGVVVGGAMAQPTPDMMARELAALRNDVQLLDRRVGELGLLVEELRRENSSLQSRANQSFVTLSQLNEAIADMNRTYQSGMTSQRRDILQHVATQMERLAKQTQAALDAVAKNQATRPAVTTDFKEDYPKQGVSYTVQSGDTLSGIAQKLGASVQDIVNANKITDPTKIRVGQTLFIPQGR